MPRAVPPTPQPSQTETLWALVLAGAALMTGEQTSEWFKSPFQRFDVASKGRLHGGLSTTLIKVGPK